jgi:hypothetical protein
MSAKIVSVDQAMGATTKWHDVDGDVVIENTLDVESLIEHNKAQFNQIDERARYGEFTKVASIDMLTWLDLKKKGILDDQVRLKRWLNDPDNRYYRTRPGTV